MATSYWRSRTFFAAPRLAGAVFFFVTAAALGLPASAFLGAAVFLLIVGLGLGFAASVLLTLLTFLAVVLPAVDLEGGLEFCGDNPCRHQRQIVLKIAHLF